MYVTNPENDKVFLLNHNKAKTWLMPGGHVDEGNSLRQTAVEELSEELNLDILGFKLEPIHIAEIETKGSNAGHVDVTLCYKIEVADTNEVGKFVQEKEAAEARWFDVDEASNLPEFTNLPAVNQKIIAKMEREIDNLSKLDIDTVVFDYGGVFTDHYCFPYFQDLTNELQVDHHVANELLSEKSDHGKKYRLNQITREEFWKVVVKGGNNPNVNIDRLESLWELSYQPDPRMLSLAHKLKLAGKKVALLMNTDTRRLKYISDNPIITKNIDHIFTSCETGFIKPDPLIFNEVIKSLRVDPAKIVYLDDRSSHTESARQLGINSIDYHPAQNPTSQLIKFNNR